MKINRRDALIASGSFLPARCVSLSLLEKLQRTLEDFVTTITDSSERRPDNDVRLQTHSL